MTRGEIGAALARRIRRPGGWVAVVFFTLVNGWAAWPGTRLGLGSVSGWVSALVVPLVLFGAFTWLSPIPWEWTGRPGGRPGFWRGLIQALLGLEGFMALLLALDFWLKAKAGVPVYRAGTLFSNLVVIVPVMVVVGGLMARHEAERKDKEEARQRALESQHRLLQSQLHPHVLYNALNGLAELVLKDPPQAERSIRSLSQLLRQLLQASDQATLPLSDERRLVTHYLDIEAMRLGDRLQLEWDWDARLDAFPVPPMILQPLVENAVKHGISPAEEGGLIRVTARHEGGRLRLGVWNTGTPLGARTPGGIGIRNLEDRLKLVYGDFARLSLKDDQGGTLAEITVDLEGD